ncbi:MAG TPA: MFS transporter [Burkholderiaceae bacterium]|nr:MFS transporter [Burkholderiaceae bacterium]HRP27411.1 MFS transporter [Burkholderiaceae bacterium]
MKPPAPAAPRRGTPGWVILLALTGAFTLSQAFRTVAAIMAPQLEAEFTLTPQALGVFAGAFHFAFGALQLLMGVGIDLYGVRRTALAAFPLAIAGSLLSAWTTNFEWLVFAQVLIGVGCAPAFLVCTVFIARHFPPAQYASVSGAVLGIGGIGMLATGTPLAWLIEAHSWRAGFVVLGAASALSWLLILAIVREPASSAPARSADSVGAALRGFGALFTTPHTLGILALSAVTYAAFITLRGLWIGPLLIARHDFSLVQSGNVAIAMSIASMLSAPLIGRLDPGAGARRRWIVGFTIAGIVTFTAMAFNPGALVDVGGAILYGLISGFIVLQYADVRGAYPESVTGRAIALFTMAMFLGIALMQWLTGLVASIAAAHGADPFVAVLGTIALLLAAGAAAFAWLPRPPGSAAGRL